ncbi:1-acyl-sn-glycerol-3-phosphate acyltransferase [Marinobacterium marinum]|uniref:1-acyl-sn-glycerol-3-phosphate acyltransferase n=1 Tax=Marinobacterium marinum TaxID=2756129 RepID=A0A7W1WYL7_9GAMM|nr:1-acyl-sn-glycerol-3-phosphate acyltransferase [Marinobacterium marinum]MBA4502538.1 1-acyl-sn-glycerol-3-phosphate acyltransferase [Marinobacterium marinum]
MFKLLCRLIFKFNKWSIVSKPPADIKKCVMVGAPHTSNWDFIYLVAAYSYMGLPNPRFTIKKEWMIFPVSLLLSSLGAIPIDRTVKKAGERRLDMVEEMARYIDAAEEITVLVTPEASRAPATRWKTGFYRVALKANVPILLGYLDYDKKEAGVGKVVYPSGDLDKDLRTILDFYNGVSPKHPERYIKI